MFDNVSMKKEAAKEALKKLIADMLGLEGKSMMNDDEEKMDDSEKAEGEMDGKMDLAKAMEEGMEPKIEVPADEVDEEMEERRNFMTGGGKKLPSQKSVTVVMGVSKPKMKMKKGM